MPLSNLAEYKEAVRSDIVGNTSFMTATLPNGNILKSVVSVDESQTIVLTVTTTQTNRPQLQINFPVLADLRQAYYEDSFIEVNLPINLPLDAYPVVGLVLYLGKILLSAKIAKQVELAQRANPALLIPGIGLAPCIRHDLECTGLFGTGTFPWLSGSKVLFFFPCIGPVVADILDCCKEHDVALWCSHNNDDLLKASFDVVNCVLLKLLESATKELCAVLEVLLAFGEVALAMLCISSIASWVTWLSAALYALALGVMYVIAEEVGDDLKNFNNAHDRSCLCGGYEGTALCADGCRDVCKEMNKFEVCGNCYYSCDLDTNGNYVKKLHRDPLRPGNACCPGSVGTQGTNGPCSDIKCPP